jgi:hypothetical protein
MSIRRGAPTIAAAWLLMLVIAASPAAAKRGAITGKLTRSGLTVIALADNGKASAVRARGKRFRVVPPAARVTVHLRGRNGVYAGPVVVARRGAAKVVLGIREGAKLGTVKVLRGYATPTRKLGATHVDRRSWARARRGVPIGGRVLGG